AESEKRMTMVRCIKCCTRKFFFFQAEGGIRNKLVTGVQTCALPISDSSSSSARERARADDELLSEAMRIFDFFYSAYEKERPNRSEERRVGKDGGQRRLNQFIRKISKQDYFSQPHCKFGESFVNGCR